MGEVVPVEFPSESRSGVVSINRARRRNRRMSGLVRDRQVAATIDLLRSRGKTPAPAKETTA